MKLIVTESFLDKESDFRLVEKGKEIEVEEERANELISSGKAEEVKSKKKKKEDE